MWKNLAQLYLKIILGVGLFFILGVKIAVAAEDIKQVTIVNPIRGSDFWGQQQDILDTPKKQYEVITKNNLPATWLIRYDALKDSQVEEFVKSLNASQEVGIFLEVTPQLAKDAGIEYKENPKWHSASSIFLTGYLPEERNKLIDAAFAKYQKIFKTYPKSIGAWWIDAYSLSFTHSKYGVEVNLDVADQYSTDEYKVWGQYWSTPFYPAKNNALVPAKSAEQKIGVVTIQWATRDPFNSYGKGSFESIYSVQPNDYMLHKLDSSYFEKLLDIYPQITVGLENDFSWEKYGGEYQKQMEVLSARQNKGLLQLKTMSGFAKYYQRLYPGVSPDVLIVSDDPLGSFGKVVWYQTPNYRLGWFYQENVGSEIRDLRLYDDSLFEKCFKIVCNDLNLTASEANALDKVAAGNSWVIDEGEISDFKVSKEVESVEISYRNQANNLRVIKFLPQDIKVNDQIWTIPAAILAAKQPPTSTSNQDEKGSNDSLALNQNWRETTFDAGKFFVAVLLFFVLPGWVLSRRFLLAPVVGWSLFTLGSYLLGFLQLDLFLWAVPILSAVALVKIGLPKLILPRLNIWETAVVILGSLSWFLTTAKSGLQYNFGWGFWGPNGHDGIWHLSLISQLQKNIPPQNPVFAGEKLSNYHYFFDLLLAKTGVLLDINNSELLFRLFPLLITPILGIVMLEVVKKIFQDKKAAFFATFFLYFGGSFGWAVSYFKNGTFGGESMFWAQQSISTLLNPPFAISLIMLLAGIYLFIEFLEKGFKQKSLVISLIILWGTLIEFKVYAGILTMLGLGIVAASQLIFKKDLKLLAVFGSCLALSLLVFLPNNLNSTALISFSPLWLVSSMISFTDRLGWDKLAHAYQAYLATFNISKLLMVEILSLGIFIVGNFGSRIIGIVKIIEVGKKIKNGDRISIFLISVFSASLVIPLLFVQRGNNWNIVQFLYYGMFIGCIFAGGAIAGVWNRWGKKLGATLSVLVILITIPTTLDTLLSQSLPARPPARISTAEMEALSFLKQQPEGVILTLPFDSAFRDRYLEPRPLFAYTSTAYVSAFSGHSVFLEDTINLEILGVDYKGRLNEMRDFVKIKDQSKEILQRNNIRYVYVPKVYGFEEDEGKMGIKKIFDNREVKIFKAL